MLSLTHRKKIFLARIPLALLLFAVGCAPMTQYRRSALVPVPAAPPYHGEPLARGQVDLSGQFNIRNVVPTAGRYGGPALWIPGVEWGGSVLAGVTNWLSLGGTGRYAHGRYGQASATGTPPLAKDADDLWVAGPQVALGGKFYGGKLFASGYASLELARIPWATWKLGERGYSLDDRGHDLFVTYRAAGFFGGRPHRMVAVYGGVMTSPRYINIGFSDAPMSGSTVQQSGSSWMPLVGMRLDIPAKPAPFLRLAMTFPLSDEAVTYLGPGWDFGFGLRL